MPLRLISAPKRWSWYDLPILPFLAPRVFQPWPYRSCRAYSRPGPTTSDGIGDDIGGLQDHNNPKKPCQKGIYTNVSSLKGKDGSLRETGLGVQVPSLAEAREGIHSKESVNASVHETSAPFKDAAVQKLSGRKKHQAKTRSLKITPIPVRTQSKPTVKPEFFLAPARTGAAHFRSKRLVPDILKHTRNRGSGLDSSQLPQVLREEVIQPRNWRHPPEASVEPEERFCEGKSGQIDHVTTKEHPEQVNQHATAASPIDEAIDFEHPDICVEAKVNGNSSYVETGPSEGPPESHQRQTQESESNMFPSESEVSPWALEKITHRRGLSETHWRVNLDTVEYLAQNPKSLSERSPSLRNRIESIERFPLEDKRWLIMHPTSASLRESWRSLPSTVRDRMWQELIITTLRFWPGSALKVIFATLESPFPYDYDFVSCSIKYIICHYLPNDGSGSIKASDTINQLFESVVHLLIKEHPRIWLSGYCLFLLAKNLQGANLKRLYIILDQLGHPMTENCLMIMGQKFAKAGESSAAFDVLRKLHENGSDFSSPKLMSLCTTLLRRDYRADKSSASDSELFEFMLERGLQPNIIIFNLLIKNAMDAGNPEAGWRIYDMMVTNSTAPDAYTYSIMLKDARLRMDRSALERLATAIRNQGLRNTYVATELLLSTLTLIPQMPGRRPLSKRIPSPAMFQRMLPFYGEYFNLQSLCHILPVSISDELVQANDGKEDLLEPTWLTLFVMIWGYLESCETSRAVRLFYDHFRSLVLAGDPTVAELVKVPHVYNLVLMALGRFHETVTDCPRLIGDMISPLPGKDSGEQEYASSISDLEDRVRSRFRLAINNEHDYLTRSPPISSSDSEIGGQPSLDVYATPRSPFHASAPTPHTPPVPDIYTWSILLKVFMDHGQPRAAEKVLEMMTTRDVSPNEVTWHSLAYGYMKLKDPAKSAETIYRGQQAGYEALLMPLARWVANFPEATSVWKELWANEDVEIPELAEDTAQVIGTFQEFSEGLTDLEPVKFTRRGKLTLKACLYPPWLKEHYSRHMYERLAQPTTGNEGVV